MRFDDPHKIAVIIGIGEVTEKLRAPAQGSEPVALMEQALRAAEQDTGADALLARIDSLDIVSEHSWPYHDVVALLNERIGAQPRHAVYGETGGESPVRFIHEAALRIARGESTLAAVVGAESTYTVAAAKKAGVTLDWAPRNRGAKLVSGDDLVNPIAVKHGVFMPVQVYPFYDNAAQASWGQTQREALAESGAIWSRYASVAAENEYAWLRKPYTPDEITTPSESNRLVAWPYTKHMVANPMVNQGAAVIVASLAEARRLGIAEDRLVYIWGGAAANEPRDYLKRDQYTRSHAQDAVLTTTAALAGIPARAFQAVELYSCFPCVPKMARRVLDLPADFQMTSTGGLSFFGAPLNNYMTHAAAGIVRGLRGKADAKGLLYGQGEYVTKHHAIVLATTPPPAAPSEDYRVESVAAERSGPVPELVDDYVGPATVETFTVVYGRSGDADFGTVIARTPAGQRLMARVPASDTATLARLTDLDARPVGLSGTVEAGDGGRLHWHAN